MTSVPGCVDDHELCQYGCIRRTLSHEGKLVHLIVKPLSEDGLGMHIMSQYKDALHVADLGVSQHICGNVLWLLCYSDMPPRHPADNMAQVWGDILDVQEKGYQNTIQSCYLELL